MQIMRFNVQTERVQVWSAGQMLAELAGHGKISFWWTLSAYETSRIRNTLGVAVTKTGEDLAKPLPRPGKVATSALRRPE